MLKPDSSWLFAATIFCSSFLLFLVQPLIAKQILPWFGGSAAVWMDLPPVLLAQAVEKKLHLVLVHDEAEDSSLRRTDWVLLARDPARLQPFAALAQPVIARQGLRVWSDDFNNLLAVLR